VFENAFKNIERVTRNDEGLASGLGHAEQTSWPLFLKCLDDLEAEREGAAALVDGRDYATLFAIMPSREARSVRHVSFERQRHGSAENRENYAV
jgi:hypothetical protein